MSALVVFGYTTWLRDGRDQFFQPLRPTALNYFAALRLPAPEPFAAIRFLAEWLTAPIRKFVSGSADVYLAACGACKLRRDLL